MPTFIINKIFSLLFFFLLLFTPSSPSFANFSFSLSSYSYSTLHSLSSYSTLLSLSHSLADRVANLRASRGDFAGSARAWIIARNIESVQELGLREFTWKLGWDYLKNYGWRDINTASFTTLASAVSDINEMRTALEDFSRVDSDTERVAWVGQNYHRFFIVSRSLLDKLFKIFRQSRPLKEVVETMQKEVVEGDLLRDCLELGTNDLKGLIQILKDIALQYTDSTSSQTEL